MPINKDFAQRLDILDSCLRRGLRKWDAGALLAEVNRQLGEKWNKSVSRRTLFSDLNYLQDELYAPVKKTKERGRVYYGYDDAEFSIKKLPLTGEDVGYLKDAAEMLRQISGLSIIEDVDEIIKKLEHTAAPREQNTPAIIFERHSVALGAEHIDSILQAIKARTTLKVSYQPFGELKPFDWIIHPYLLKEFRGRWFMIGRKDDAPISTNLALDRIRKLSATNRKFIPNNLFEPTTVFGHVVGVSLPEGEPVQDIHIKVYGRQCFYIRTKPIHISQAIIEADSEGECMTISLQLVNNYELRSVLLGYGPDVEVLKPEKLRVQMTVLLKEASGRYK